MRVRAGCMRVRVMCMRVMCMRVSITLNMQTLNPKYSEGTRMRVHQGQVHEGPSGSGA